MLENPLLRTVASTGEVFESRIVARKDRGIRQPVDLKGKRVEYAPNTISEYALHAFLLQNNIAGNGSDVLNFIDTSPLDTIAHERVTIFR